MGQCRVGPGAGRVRPSWIALFITTCLVTVAATLPKVAFAQVPPTDCFSLQVNAATCFTGTYTNNQIVETSTGSAGSAPAAWNTYSNASLTVTSAGLVNLIKVANTGGDGNSANQTGGSGSPIKLENAGPLTWSASIGEFLAAQPAILLAEARGGKGYTPSSNGYGGVGGATDSITVSLTNSGTIAVTGQTWYGVLGMGAYSIAGAGGNANTALSNFYGGNGGNAGAVSVSNSGSISLGTANTFLSGNYAAVAIDVRSLGGDGGGGSCSNYLNCQDGNVAATGNGGGSGLIEITNRAAIAVYWSPTALLGVPNEMAGINALAKGGAGSDSQNNYSTGGIGGSGGSISISNDRNITLSAGGSFAVEGAAIFARAQGGNGGVGQKELSGNGAGGNGGSVQQLVSVGGQNVAVSVTHGGSAIISTTGNQVAGIVAMAAGGAGGSGQDGWNANNSSGGAGGAAGAVVVSITGTAQVLTNGQNASGVMAQGIGGAGGNGGTDGGLVGQPGGAGIGGAGAGAQVTADAGTVVQTVGDNSVGIGAQSIGGGGGSGSKFVSVLGGQSGQGGRGGDACLDPGSTGCGAVFNTIIKASGTVRTSGSNSYGLLAQSIGGGGGAGGISDGLIYSLGGDGGAGGAGAGVSVESSGTVQTRGYGSHGILAHSIGGGGGAAGVATGAIAIGGNGATGYTAIGGQVVVTQTAGLVQTFGDAAAGILAQSIGSGGGSGGGSTGIISVGGTGAGGGNGGSVQVTVDGSIITAGSYSYGVVGQSIGGGGGAGGNVLDYSLAIPTVGIGGSSSSGGAGGAVTLDFGGSVTTTGDHAFGLVAQSIGGGGGSGGDVSGLGILSFASLTIGGGSSSAAGGAAGLVTINTSGTGAPTVRTAGAYAVGVLGQSIGGGGGTGGNASGFDAALNFATSLTVGGNAGGGGAGGNVSINWQGGSIVTGTGMRAMSTAAYQPISLMGQAGNAYGLVAQSIGGGGGSGGSASLDQFVGSLPSELVPVPTINIGASVGGTLGAGGAGGRVNVEVGNTSITTWGAGAHAILAQSIGGGGGTGGDASAIAVAAAIPGTNDLPTVDLSFAVGGSGGSGGSGQAVAVQVDKGSVVGTYGDNANAIVAQSIGAGGGDAGVGNAATFTLFEALAPKVRTALGGKGGVGGSGGDVTVTVDARALLYTVGSGSRGIVAQSIGGGGGTSQGGTIGLAVGPFVGTVQVGREGGSGNVGGTVNVSNAGLITTLAKDADGILAQSIGGGGGLGGTFGADGSWDNPNWINFIWDVQRVVHALSDLSAGYSMTVTVGGSGGSGAQGGAVSIANTGIVRTSGDWANGIVAQSIGGGGGVGGTAVADGSQQTASANIGVGGTGGISGDGGAVTIQSVGVISTQGYSAYGLLAQSIGGGGGRGGDGSALSSGTITVGGGIGGSAGSSGQGGIVQLLDTASNTVVSTRGDYAHGIVLQSIGGGGGIGGTGSSTTPLVFQNQGFDIVVGGSAGSQGDGCAVIVGGATSNGNCQAVPTGVGTSLWIRTEGRGAYGLVAQSIGGGGGIGGAANSSSSASVVLGGRDGSAGNGNLVSLALENSQIATSGTGAHAIVAQSIGGGGGIAGDPSGAPFSPLMPPLPGLPSSGSGGDVAVMTGIGARIRTSGDYAYGIVAQSIGGGGGLSGSTVNGSLSVNAGANIGTNANSGSVNVTINGTLSTSGYNAVGVFAQSAASGGSGAVTVDVEGTVVGGSGPRGYGVLIAGGNSSNAIIVGTQGSISALSGTALSYYGNFRPTLTNNGSVQGNVLLRSDVGALGQINNAGTLIAGNLLDANVANSGRLSVVHTSSAFATTVITGNYSQSSSGTTIIGGDLTAGASDRLQITGSAVLDGRVSFNFRTMRPNQSVTVLTADGGITGRLTADNGPGLFSYQLQQTGNAVSVSVAGANLASPSFGLNASQTAVANGLQNIWNAGGGTFDGLFAALQSAAASGSYGDALSKLSPGVALAPAARSRDNVQEFSNNLMSCPVFETDSALVGETQCSWARVGGRLTNQSTSGGIAGFNNWLMNYQVGAQVEIAPDWFLGGSLAYQQSWLSGTDGRVSSNGNGGSVGVVLKRELGPWLFAGSLGGSMSWYDTKRTIAIPGLAPTVAYGNSTVLSGQARLRAAYSLAFQDWYVRPYADVDLIHVSVPGYSETGAGALGLTYDTASQWNVAFSPTMEVGGRINLQGGHTFRPYASAGLTAFTNSSWTSTARLQGGLGAGSFTSTLATDPVVARFSAGFQLLTKDSFDFRLTYDGAFSEHTVSNALSLKAAMRF
jgi:uncharacterized protein YhjY with autotransporter beta-barrel domain